MQELTQYVMAERGMNTTDQGLLKTVSKRVGSFLRHHRAKGVLQSQKDADGFLRTAPVGSFPRGRSPFGLDDMAGNVWEWTSSRFPGSPGMRVIRGGGWGNNPYCLRAAYRHGNPPDIGLDMVGFRCAAD